MTRSMPRLYVRRRLCSAFWWEKLPSHQIFRSLSAAKYSGVFRFFACSCRASSCSIRSTMRLFLELPTHCCRQGQLLHYLIESYIVHHTGKIRTSSPSGTGSDFSFLSKISHTEPVPPVLPVAEPGASYVRKNNPLWAILLLKRLPDCIRQPGSRAVILELSL